MKSWNLRRLWGSGIHNIKKESDLETITLLFVLGDLVTKSWQQGLKERKSIHYIFRKLMWCEKQRYYRQQSSGFALFFLWNRPFKRENGAPRVKFKRELPVGFESGMESKRCPKQRQRSDFLWFETKTVPKGCPKQSLNRSGHSTFPLKLGGRSSWGIVLDWTILFHPRWTPFCSTTR